MYPYYTCVILATRYDEGTLVLNSSLLKVTEAAKETAGLCGCVIFSGLHCTSGWGLGCSVSLRVTEQSMKHFGCFLWLVLAFHFVYPSPHLECQFQEQIWWGYTASLSLTDTHLHMHTQTTVSHHALLTPVSLCISPSPLLTPTPPGLAVCERIQW